MVIIVALLLVVCAASPHQLVMDTTPQQLTIDSLSHIFQTDGVLRCISKKDAQLSINNIKLFCGEENQENRLCYSSYNNLKLCLINNNCQNTLDQLSIPLPCWSCWANMLTDSQQLKDYQQMIEPCALSSPLAQFLLALSLMFLLIF